jgi:phage FluMu protein Com
MSKAHGFCPRCNKANVYSKISCDYCGKRLPWANVLAVDAGEKCPHCSAFNRYDEKCCGSCGELLPWSEATDFLRRARAKGDAEDKSLFVIITACGVVFWLMMLWSVMKR